MANSVDTVCRDLTVGKPIITVYLIEADKLILPIDQICFHVLYMTGGALVPTEGRLCVH